MNGFKSWVASNWFVLPNGSVALRLTEPQESLTSQQWNCRTGDRASYKVGLSADHDTLALTLETDACQTRAAILAGAGLRRPLTDGGCPGWAERPERLEPSPGAVAVSG